MKNKGFSLIEVIVYIFLLSVLMIGVFSSTFGSIHYFSKKPNLTDKDYQMLIKNDHE